MKLLKVGWLGAFATAALACPAAFLLDAFSTEAQEIGPLGAAEVKVNRDMFKMDALSKDDPKYAESVVNIYGNPHGKPIRFLFVPKDKFFHPQEMPSLTLLPVARTEGEDVLQMKTVYFVATRSLFGAAGVGVLFLGAWAYVRRRRRKVPQADGS
jgi:hypothetical protein